MTLGGGVVPGLSVLFPLGQTSRFCGSWLGCQLPSEFRDTRGMIVVWSRGHTCNLMFPSLFFFGWHVFPPRVMFGRVGQPHYILVLF